MKAHFVTFLSPGTMFTEDTTEPIESWDSSQAMEMAHSIKERHGATPFGFYFTTRERKDNELDSKEVKRSKMFYLGGEVLTLAQVKKTMPTERILIGNMENNGYAKIIVNTNSWKITQPFREGDTLLEFTPKKTA